jgi:hypothetical protein
MTVCIASICNGNTIIGAADRMITSGDIEFEPALDSLPVPAGLNPIDRGSYNLNTKIFALTRYIVALTAGDSGLQSEILQSVYLAVTKRIFTNRDQ